METFLGLLLIAVIVYLVSRRGKKTRSSDATPRTPSNDRTKSSSSYTGRSTANPTRQRHVSNPSYAVVDLETSALRPKDGRIIEIGIVHLDRDGTATHRWETLVNPGDGVSGRVDIHGIKSEWLAAAPTFEEVAGDVVERLRGRVLVAHNARFDTEWLDSEFNRMAKPFGDYGALCTMQVARALGLPAKLSGAASALGHRFTHHTAIEDAEAAGRIVAAGLNAGMTGHESSVLDASLLPVGLAPSERVVVRQAAAEAVLPRPFLTEAMLLAEVPDNSHTGDEDAYLDVLERCLEDGFLDSDEQAELAALAADLGLTHERALELHGQLIDSLVDAALDDDTVTSQERHEVETAAAWLGVDLSDWQRRVKAGRQRRKDAQARFQKEVFGKTIAFVGRGGHPRDVRDALAVTHGIEPRTRLTKDTDIVAIGSATTRNKSTQDAAEQGLPVMLEYALWSRLGATTPDPPSGSAPMPGVMPKQPVGFALADVTMPGVAAGSFEGRLVHEWADAVRQLRREGRVVAAERVLIGCIQATEADARRGRGGVAPFYYEQLAILYSKAKRLDDELAVLERYAAAPHAPGMKPGQLHDRLHRVREKVTQRDS